VFSAYRVFSSFLATDFNTVTITVSLNYTHSLLFTAWLSTEHWARRQSQGHSQSYFVLATSPLRLTTRTFIFQLNTCGYSPYVTSCLTRGCGVVYNCCWASPAQSFWSPSPAGLMTTFYCLRFETPPYLYPPGTGYPSYTTRYWVPFSSPPATRRAAVEVFDPASTREAHMSSLLQTVPVITSLHGPYRKHRSCVAVPLLRSCLLGFPRDRYSASPLAR
jgi:hypothetical protein